MYAFDANMAYIAGDNLISGVDKTKTITISGAVYAIFRVQKEPLGNLTPSDATAAQIGVSDNSIYTRMGKAGTQYIYGAIAPNTGGPRSGNIVLKSKAGAATYTLPTVQAGATGNIYVNTPTISAGYVHIPVTVAVTSAFGSWSISQRDSWITPSQYDGPGGTTNVTLTISDNMVPDPRTGTITFFNVLTSQTAVVTVNQDGAPTSIGITPFRVLGPKAGGDYIVPAVAMSGNDWIMSSAPSWVSITPTAGVAGQTAIGIAFNSTNNTGAKRSGYLKMRNTTTNEIAICIIEQEG